jgi:ABC-2 type transport system ATP-binding protein
VVILNNIILELKHLKKYYGSNLGIEDVSLKLNKGEIYGFIGPNGAGKSTTIRTILGLINKTNGDIYFKGKKIDIDDINVKQKIGYLPSEIYLYGDMTVKELFDYHSSFYDKNLNKKRKELINLLKIDEKKKIEDLSLGNLKKVGIVLALMHEPELLILDEPTSGLDPIMQSIFHNLLLEEKSKGTTILLSSHVLSEVSSICDRIGFIKDGVIIKEDTIENIKKNNYTYLTISSNQINDIKNELQLPIKSESKNEVIFINNIDANTLIKKLYKYKIDKLLLESISLEDLFINFYK